MALLARSQDFTDKDFDALRLRLVRLVQSVFPEWTDFHVASFGNLLVELYAFVGDVVTYYQDAQARESRITTATQRKNLLALVKLLGYRPAGAQAATADVAFTLASPPGADVLIPKGTVVSTTAVANPLRFELLDDVTIPAGASPAQATGTVEHSEAQEERFASTGLPNQQFALHEAPFLDGSAAVTAADGSYLEVPNFLSSRVSDRHFTVLIDQNDRATLRFGNGVESAVPSGTVVVAYKTSGGAQGNVDAGTLRRLEGSFTDAAGSPVTVSVTNPAAASGGVDRESLAQIRRLAPASIRVLTRTVAREDFEIHALGAPGVARALMLTSNEDPAIEENSGILFLIPQGGSLPSAALKDHVLEQVTVVYPCTLTFDVSVQDPVYRSIDIRAEVALRQGANSVAVAAAIRKALAGILAVSLPDGTPNPQVDFGFNLKKASGDVAAELPFSELFDAVAEVPGVRKVHEQSFLPADDVKLDVREFPVLGKVSLFDLDSGRAL